MATPVGGGTPSSLPPSSSPVPLEQLKRAVLRSDIATLQSADPQTLRKHASELLFYVQTDAIVNFLIAHGADLNARDEDNSTPLLAATMERRHGAVRALIERGADCNTVNRLSYTPLTALLEVPGKTGQEQKESEAIALLLLDKGTDPSLPTSWGSTALHLAASLGMLSLVRAILERTHDLLDAADASFRTPLYKAMRDQCEDVAIELYNRGASVFLEPQQKKSTVLHFAVQNNLSHLVGVILEKEPKLLDLQNAEGVTPFVEAILQGNEPLALLLLQRGAAPTTSCLPPYKTSPLHLAAEYGMLQLVRSILDKTLDLINAQDATNATPLLCAIRSRYMRVALELLQRGADASAQNASGETVLCFAIKHSASYENIQLLLAKGAGAVINTSDNWKNTPLSLCIQHSPQNESEKVLNLLLDNGALPYSQLLHIAAHNQTNTHLIPLLLTRCEPLKLCINERDTTGKTPLYIAVEVGNVTAVAYLLKAGADPDLCALHNGYSPLHICATLTNSEIASLLTNYHANPNARDRYGRTPLHTAAIFNQKWIIPFLQEAGANPNLPDSAGNTPAHIAARNGDEPFLKILLKKPMKQ